mgnify:CR=1 FL=1
MRLPAADSDPRGSRAERLARPARNGTTSLFAALDVATGRVIGQTQRRHRSAEFLKFLRTVEANVPEVLDIHLVMDNLSTHAKKSVTDFYGHEVGTEIWDRFTVHYTPKHGSWLNVAECELSCLTSQCLKDRRIGDLATLQAEIAAWSTRVNAKQRAVDWQFTIDNARVKLKRLYPKM